MRRRWTIQSLDLILFAFLSVACMAEASVEANDYTHCEYTVKKWASSSINSEVHNNKLVLRDLLFFLHIPRTGGRTYFYCFLGKLYSTSQQCPRSYDKLRFNPREKNCRLISTHDDYSVMSKFPRDRVSVVTILRNPIDRVFSTYEFSVEVAARFLIHPNLTSLAKGDKMLQLARKKSSSTVSTLDIWPWKYLVPWIRKDLFARRDARRLRGLSGFTPYNSYEMKEFVMPLHDYINDPNVRDIVHNGATFQITGLTNNSYSAESHEVRHCVLRHPSLGKHVLEVAKKRLDEMLYVGLTENHKESATMFANVVGAQVISFHVESNHTSTDVDSDDGSEQNQKADPKNQGSRNKTREKMTVPRLMEAYESCMVPLRKSHSTRRTKSLKLISPVNFTKEERNSVSEANLLEIASLNSLDMELYSYAQHLFDEHQNRIHDDDRVSSTREKLYLQEEASINISSSKMNADGEWRNWYLVSREFLAASSSIGVLSLLLFLYVKSRRGSKVKL